MARTGTIERRQQRWYAKLSLGGGRRKKIALPRGISEAKAREMAAKMAEDLAAGVFVAPPPRGGEKCASTDPTASTSTWFDAFSEYRTNKKKLTDGHTDRSRFKNWIEPVIGAKPMDKVTRREVEKIRDILDEKVNAGELSWKTAWNVWGLVTSMFKAAVSSKSRDLCVRTDNPTVDVEGPERGEELGNVHLFPSEFVALITSGAVPLYRRRLYIAAAFTGARQGELRALLWTDVDLEHGIIRISKSIERKTRKVKSTKAKRVRDVPVESALSPLLEAMKEEAESDRVLRVPPAEDCAELLRKDLLTAGVDRPAIHGLDDMVHRLTFHALRDSYCTWRAVRGDAPVDIMTHAGHRSFATTQRYLDLAKTLRAGGGYGAPFSPLPEEVIVPSDLSPSPPKLLKQLRPQWDLNPCYRRERPVS
jgi:integrase